MTGLPVRFKMPVRWGILRNRWDDFEIGGRG